MKAAKADGSGNVLKISRINLVCFLIIAVGDVLYADLRTALLRAPPKVSTRAASIAG